MSTINRNKILSKSVYQEVTKAKRQELERIQAQRGPYKMAEYLEFCEWYAAPIDVRKEHWGKNVTTMAEFASHYNLSVDTLTDWKKRPEFSNLISTARQSHADDAWGEIMQGWKKSISGGNAFALELWLAYFMGWDKKLVIEEKHKLNLDMGDVRSLIDQLPETKQGEFYEVIGRLLHEAQSSVAGQGEGGNGGPGQLQAQAHLPEPAHEVS